MIVIQLIGGLGNQMFQYSFGLKQASDKKTKLGIDISQFKFYKLRDYDLSHFAILARVMTESELKPFQEKKIEKILRNFRIRKNTPFKNVRNDSGGFDILIKRDDYGQWNTIKHFSGIEEIIRKEFTLKEPQDEKYNSLIKKIQSINSVSIHIRRSDYLANKNKRVFIECTPEYYKKALETISEGQKEMELYIFSDDTDWVKKNIPFNFPVTFVSEMGFADYQELMLMSACKRNITANSTFSWWGAWLNQNPDKMVVTPAKWFIDEKKNTDDIILKEWIKI